MKAVIPDTIQKLENALSQFDELGGKALVPLGFHEVATIISLLRAEQVRWKSMDEYFQIAIDKVSK